MIQHQTNRLRPRFRVVLARHDMHLPKEGGAHQTRDGSHRSSVHRAAITQLCESNRMLAGLLRPYVRPYRGLIALVAGFQPISTLALLYLPTVNASIIDDGVAKGDTHTIIRLGGLMLLVTGLQVLCAVGALYAGSRASIGFGRDLRSAMFHHVTGSPSRTLRPWERHHC